LAATSGGGEGERGREKGREKERGFVERGREGEKERETIREKERDSYLSPACC
jgi:hypothetical protein